MDADDVRLEGVSHAQIIAWVKEGRAGNSTHVLENRMQSILTALQHSGDEVNRAVQQANGGDWEGATAASASTAMSTLRDFDDEMHTHSTNNRYSAMGQSGESAATRDRVPEMTAPLEPNTPPTILSQTVDHKVTTTAQRNAEDRAREVMAQYNSATQQRLSSMPKVQSVPKVVLDTGDKTPPGGHSGSGGSGSGGSQTPMPGDGTGTTSSYTAGSPSGTQRHNSTVPDVPGQHAPTQSTNTSSAAPPPNVTAPGTGGLPQAPSGSAPVNGGSGPYGTSPYGGGPYGSGPGGGSPERFGGRGGTGGTGGLGGRGAGGAGGAGAEGGNPARGGAQSGARPGMAAAEEGALGRRGVLGGRSGGAGAGGMMGGGAGGRGGDDDKEHTSRYGLPSDEHFEGDEEFLRDPRNSEFYVAPDVIGGPE